MTTEQVGSTGTSRESGLADAGLTRVIIGAFYDVYNELGYGFLEAVYRNALAVRLRERGLSVRQEVLFELTYHGVDIGQYRADLIVGDSVVVEVKSVERLALAHHAQLSNYMRASGIGLGLLLNFGVQPTVKRRLISGRTRSDPIWSYLEFSATNPTCRGTNGNRPALDSLTMPTLPTTLGALKTSPFGDPARAHRSVKDEIRVNLLARLAEGGPLFAGVRGYDDTVVPQIVNALLSRHHFILLGLRGQAKSRILRALTTLLDEKMPIVAGSEINDSPFRPVSKFARELLTEAGDDTPITWVGRDQRYVEKLATPDVTIADLIGDLDPIKAARGGHLLADELTIHYGMLPRANRGLFALNELPDLAGKVQVGLFNVMQEGDVQIKGYPVRLPLDVVLCFTANPEDYTARGKIITPLKDRIGSEIVTHYPETVALGMQITAQEAWIERPERPVRLPTLLAELVERVAFEARIDKRVDRRSGVSQRLPISALENVISNAERRAVRLGDDEIVPRLTDAYAALPAITGKLELEYEGELVGGAVIARELIRRAADATLRAHAPQAGTDDIVMWFDVGSALQVAEDAGAAALRAAFETVPGLVELVIEEGLAPASDDALVTLACELVLEALVARRKISRNDLGEYGRAREEGRRRRGPDEGLGG